MGSFSRTTTILVTIILMVAVGTDLAAAYYGDATYYDPSVGLTACGTYHGTNDLIAALPFHWWTTANPNLDPMCQKWARVTNPQNGKSVTVSIQDKCYGCQGDDIDLSVGAFSAINELGVGRFKVNWQFV